MPKGKQLTGRQQAFILEYVKDWNATRSAIAAGYSKKTAYSIGSENLRKPEIKAEIDKRLTEMVMSSAEVLKRLSDMASSDMSDYIDIVDGKAVLNLAKAKADGKLHLVKSISPTAHGLRVELHDAQTALEKIGKYHKLFTENVDLTSGGEKITPENMTPTEIAARVAAILKNTNADGSKK
jgi:phage terminase small subunit